MWTSKWSERGPLQLDAVPPEQALELVEQLGLVADRAR
jgi:hypothetical protein